MNFLLIYHCEAGCVECLEFMVLIVNELEVFLDGPLLEVGQVSKLMIRVGYFLKHQVISFWLFCLHTSSYLKHIQNTLSHNSHSTFFVFTILFKFYFFTVNHCTLTDLDLIVCRLRDFIAFIIAS